MWRAIILALCLGLTGLPSNAAPLSGRAPVTRRMYSSQNRGAKGFGAQNLVLKNDRLTPKYDDSHRKALEEHRDEIRKGNSQPSDVPVEDGVVRLVVPGDAISPNVKVEEVASAIASGIKVPDVAF